MLKKHKYFIIAIILIFGISIYLIYCLWYEYEEEIYFPAILPIHRPSVSQLATTTPQPAEPRSSITSLVLPSINELKAETNNWKVYENGKYNIRIKYPPGWNYEDESNSVIFRAGAELADYNAPMIFLTNKPFAPPSSGASIAIFYSVNPSEIPTKESMAANFKTDKWHNTKPDVKVFSINGFEGAIDIRHVTQEKGKILGIGEVRKETGLVFRKFDNFIYYIQWSLLEAYEESEFAYPDITYQNQFFPFLASFEISENI